MSTIIISIATSIIIGAIASFVVWVIPAEKFEPEIKLACYNQNMVDDSITNINGKKLTYKISNNNDSIIFSSIFKWYSVYVGARFSSILSPVTLFTECLNIQIRFI